MICELTDRFTAGWKVEFRLFKHRAILAFRPAEPDTLLASFWSMEAAMLDSLISERILSSKSSKVYLYAIIQTWMTSKYSYLTLFGLKLAGKQPLRVSQYLLAHYRLYEARIFMRNALHTHGLFETNTVICEMRILPRGIILFWKTDWRPIVYQMLIILEMMRVNKID